MDYKSTEEYLVILAEEVKYLKPKDAKTVLSYYENKINTALDYGESEEDILERLPNPTKVAEDAYESHGFKYKELRAKKSKQKNILDKIISVIILLILISGFIGITYLSIFGLNKLIMLFTNLTLLSKVLDKVISISIVICYILFILVLYIYIFDLFYLLSIHFLVRLIKFKNEDKLLSFSISNFISNKTKVKKFNFKLLIGLLCLIICLFVLSIYLKGYCYRSLNDICNNQETYNIDNNIDTIKIYSNTIKVNIYNTEEESYYEYLYEFNNKLYSNTNNNDLELSFSKSESYDLFDLLKEPIQVINIYLNNNKNIYINTTKEVEINIVESKINNIYVETEKATIACRKAKINQIDLNSYTGYLGLAESSVDTINHETIKGQFLISENSNINNIKSINTTGLIQISDSYINTFNLDNNTGSINISNTNIDNIDINNQTSQINITNSNITNSNIELLYTSKLLISDSNVLESNIKLEASSYLVVSNIEGNNISINSSDSNIFIDEYDSNIYECNLTINTTGSNTKTEITNSKLNNIDITHKDGFLFIENSYLTGKIICEASQTVELTNNDGTLVELYLSKISKNKSTSSWINLTSDKENDLIYKIKLWDAYSASALSKNEYINLDTTEAYDEK